VIKWTTRSSFQLALGAKSLRSQAAWRPARFGQRLMRNRDFPEVALPRPTR